MAKRIAVKAKAGAQAHGPWTGRYDPGVPAELEYPDAALHELLDDAAVGVPHPIKGEEVKAFVVRTPGAIVTAEELIAFCREGLAPFKVPKAIEFRDTLPKTLIGKVLRRQLAEEDAKTRASSKPDSTPPR